MDNILDVADYIARRYKEVSGEPIDEMKLHKLLYFMQRDSFAISNEPAFSGEFKGWKYGPVSPEVRAAFCEGEIMGPTKEISDRSAYIADDIIEAYGWYASWKLSQLSHKEPAWQKSREGLDVNDCGSQTINIEDIREDAKHVDPYAWVDTQKEDELFYSESNIAYIHESLRELEEGRGECHDLLEV